MANLTLAIDDELLRVARIKALVESAAALFAVEKRAAARVVGSNADFVLDALRLARRLRSSVWNALTVQAALAARCTTLFSEDLQAGLRFGDLEVINPFADTAHEPRAAYRTKAPAKRRRSR
jgi:predicted nucleic acid-binding protein